MRRILHVRAQQALDELPFFLLVQPLETGDGQSEQATHSTRAQPNSADRADIWNSFQSVSTFFYLIFSLFRVISSCTFTLEQANDRIT